MGKKKQQQQRDMMAMDSSSRRGVMRMPGGPEWLKVGERVELRSDEEGYAGAWFEVEIGGLYPHSKQAFVKYVHFVDEDTHAAVQEFARIDNLRPLPPRVPSTRVWRPRDSVETQYKNAWWVGYIKERVVNNSTKYLVYYGRGEQDLEISYHHIRPRQNYAFPSPPHDLEGSWSLARSMQNPAIWERIEAAPAAVGKLQSRREAPDPAVGKIQPRRVSAPASNGDKSDGSRDVREEARKKRKSASASKSTTTSRSAQEPKRRSRSVEPKRKIRFVSRPSYALALPAVRAEQQSTLVLTPGSSPPPFQDCAVSPNSDSKAAPTTRSTSSNSSGVGATSCSNFSRGDNSDAEDDPIIFPDFSTEERIRNRAAYHQLLLCFRHDSKGMLDSQRHNILTALRGELHLSIKDVNDAHCAVFGMPS